MKCFMCKGETETKLVNYLVDLDKTIIIIKQVPANVCKQCGERFFDNDVMRNLEKIIDDVRKVPVEISVVNYDEEIA